MDGGVPEEIAVPAVGTVYQRMLCALMLVAVADKVTFPDPHLPLSKRAKTGNAALTVTATEVRVVDSQLAADVAVA
jgi:hypothetical protein